MNECLNLHTAAFYMSRIQSRSLESLEPKGIEPTVTPDGSKFYKDACGELIYAKYSTGAIVSLHPDRTTALTADGDYWFVNSFGLSTRVD